MYKLYTVSRLRAHAAAFRLLLCRCLMPERLHSTRLISFDPSARAHCLQMYEHHHGRPGWYIETGSSSYLRTIARSKFCLAPTGGGHGKRNILTALLGCVPVTITDRVLQPFEPEVPWTSWSVPVAEGNISRLHEILEGISSEELKAMQVSSPGLWRRCPRPEYLTTYAHMCPSPSAVTSVPALRCGWV